jgi:hypothetical protein
LLPRPKQAPNSNSSSFFYSSWHFALFQRGKAKEPRQREKTNSVDVVENSVDLSSKKYPPPVVGGGHSLYRYGDWYR